MTDLAALTKRLRWIAEFMEDHGIGVGDECDAPTLVEAAEAIERLTRRVEWQAKVVGIVKALFDKSISVDEFVRRVKEFTGGKGDG